jgi:hypothetical protein
MNKTTFAMWARPDNFCTWSKSIGHPIISAISLILAGPMMIYSCWKHFDKKPRGEGEDRHYIEEPATNGKNQVWIRLRTHPNYFLDLICSKLVNRNFGNNKGFFNIYFKNKHPVRSFTPAMYTFKRN